MKIRRLKDKEISKIIQLHKKSIFPLWKRLKRDYSVKEVKEYAGLTFKKGKVFGYFDNKKLVGCVGIVLDKKHNVGEVRHLLVHPKYQGKGIGRGMIHFIEEYARRKAKKLRLDVLIKNNKAVGFYDKLNYRKIAFIMEKKIKW